MHFSHTLKKYFKFLILSELITFVGFKPLNQLKSKVVEI